MKNVLCLLVALLGCLSCARYSYGLAEERVGPQPEAHAQSEWPAGIVELLRHETRVYSIWVNGNENFYYQANAKQINELIEHFSKMRMRDHELTIKAGRANASSFSGESFPYNVNMHVLSGIALAVTRQGGDAKTYDPKMEIHVDPVKDADLLKQLKFPDNIILNNEVASFPRMGKETKPMRKLWYANVQFDDDTPAADFEHGLVTTVSLWETDVEEGIRVGKVDHKGSFYAAFSEQELADLKTGRTWLTLTVGNWATEPKREDPRIEANKLAQDGADAEPVRIGKPKFYYGRLLFEDGSPPTLNPPPWPGGNIFVDFSYAGPVTPDAEGYFKIYFSQEQYEQVKAKKARKNIYIPSYEDKGRSTALHAFPASKLSQKKEEAGVVKIPRPAAKNPND